MDQIKQHLRDFTRSRENPKTLIKIRNFTPLCICQLGPSSDRRDIEKIILTLQAASAYTHFRGGVLWAQMPILWKMV